MEIKDGVNSFIIWFKEPTVVQKGPYYLTIALIALNFLLVVFA